MDASWEACFSLLEKLGQTLDQLGGIEKEKTAAVRRDDLVKLDGCMKREQAVSMSLRTLDQKRAALLPALGVPMDSTLSALPGYCPPQLRPRARQTCETLMAKYGVYRSAADVARMTLECSLHQVEKMMEAHYGAEKDAGGVLPGGRGSFADIRA